MNTAQFRQTINFFNDMHMEKGEPQEMWSDNTRRNIPRIKKKDSVYSHVGIFDGDSEKAVVLVGASPSLRDDVEKLKELDENFVIIVANSALKFLLEHDVKPEYVIAIDGDKSNLVGHLDCENRDMTLITSNAVAPEIFDVWDGKVIWTPYYSIDKKLKSKVRYRLGRKISVGGNAMTTAAVVSYSIFHANTLIFVGNECCYDEQYYVDKKSMWEDGDKMVFKVYDSKGRERYTNVPLHLYAQWLEKMAHEAPEGNLIDTSFGLLGAEKGSSFHVVELSDIIKQVKDSFEMKKLAKDDWRIRERLRYDKAWLTKEYIPKVGGKNWISILKKFNFSKVKTALDVGCGIGEAVKMMRKIGIEAEGIDISQYALPVWEKNEVDKYCYVCSADEMPFPDNKYDFVSCTDVMEHIPEEGVQDVLKEIYRVGNNSFLFIISLISAVHKLPDGSEPHVCVKSEHWWFDELEKAGFHVGDSHVSHDAEKGDEKFAVIFFAIKGEKNDSIMSINDLYLQQEGIVHPGECEHEISCSD